MRTILLPLLLAGCGFGGVTFIPEFDLFTAVALADLDGDGRLDEISVWARGLTATEVAELATKENAS